MVSRATPSQWGGAPRVSASTATLTAQATARAWVPAGLARATRALATLTARRSRMSAHVLVGSTCARARACAFLSQRRARVDGRPPLNWPSKSRKTLSHGCSRGLVAIWWAVMHSTLPTLRHRSLRPASTRAIASLAMGAPTARSPCSRAFPIARGVDSAQQCRSGLRVRVCPPTWASAPRAPPLRCASVSAAIRGPVVSMPVLRVPMHALGAAHASASS
mmetsp:Transcript_48817/g.97413  ORF Transcript_48817/g.97413 Transcript_48817/m.97413 type:complete len:220 (+) Transcript_48817:616-1275(+)